MCSDGVIAKQLARAVLGWMGTAGHLIWPSFIAEKEIHCNSLSATGGLGASSASLVLFRGSSADVIQSPDMTAKSGVFQGAGGEDVHFVLSLFIADFSGI